MSNKNYGCKKYDHYERARKGAFDIQKSFISVTLPYAEPLVPVATTEVTPEVVKMLGIFAGEMARSEIMDSLGLSDEKHFREHYQQAGITAGVIEMTIPDKPRSSKQKYRLTEKGRKLLQTLLNEKKDKPQNT